MFWNALIWLNEMLVGITKFSVGLFPFVCNISAVGLIYIIINKIRNKRPLIYSIKDKDTLILSGSLLASCIGLILFYMPQPVIHDSYSFDDISIQIIEPSSETDRVTINDKMRLDEFKEMFRGRLCRRSTDSGPTPLYSETVFIDLTVFDDDKVFPLHFIITQGNCRRYTAANTDFFYKIEDDEHILSDMVLEYARKYIEAAKVEDSITDYAWEVINRDIENLESNPEVNIIDSKITRLELLETFDALADNPIKVYALEYRLLPEDLSKVVLAGGMDYDENGWLKETCSMGSPLLVITYDNDEAELIGIIWTGEVTGKGGMEAEIKALLERKEGT